MPQPAAGQAGDRNHRQGSAATPFPSRPSASPTPTPPAAPLLLPSLAERLLERNARGAAANRRRFDAAAVQVVNLLAAPGAGKTALLEGLVRHGGHADRQAVIAADLATDNDARRLRAVGLAAVQITTGQACHLEACLVDQGVERLAAAGHPLARLDRLWIENVGNLVCPAAYDLGEHLRLVLLAVGEGEDKPLKYPALFRSADLVVITKIDLAEAVGFQRDQAHGAIAMVAPTAPILEVSCRSGSGLAALARRLRRLPPRRPLGAAAPQ